MDKMLERALKASVRDEVAARLGGAAASPAQVEELVAESVGELRLDYGAQLDPSEAHALVRALIDDFLYYGPLQPLLDDGSITEVMVNGGGVDLPIRRCRSCRPSCTWSGRDGWSTGRT